MAGAAFLLALLAAAPVDRVDRKGVPCDAENAPLVAIETIQGDYDRWRGRCVRLRGIARGRRLYADREALLEPLVSPGEPKHSIVLYDGAILPEASPPRVVEIVGSIFSCTDQHAIVDEIRAKDETGAIMWVTGYCHTSLENYVRPAAASVADEPPPTRLTEAEVPPERRLLVEAPADLPGLGDYVAAARALLAALADRDEAGFIRLSQPGLHQTLQEIGDDEPADGIARQVEEARAELRAQAHAAADAALPPRGRRLERILVERNELEELDDPEGHRPRHFTVCWCKEGACEGLWPVVPIDADNAPERPYFCARTSAYLLGRGVSTIQANAKVHPPGLAEPPR